MRDHVCVLFLFTMLVTNNGFFFAMFTSDEDGVVGDELMHGPVRGTWEAVGRGNDKEVLQADVLVGSNENVRQKSD